MIPNASAPLTIGQAEGGFSFSGQLDEIGIYNRALSPDEIQSIFTLMASLTVRPFSAPPQT